MDFIKTSSLRALIELTFQRKWNGLIWMSRKGVIAKRVKTVQRLYRESAPERADGWPRNECSALGQNQSVRLKSRPKFNPSGRTHITTRETMSRGRPSHTHNAAHDHAREPGNNASRPRNLTRVPRPMVPSEPGINVRVRPRNYRPFHHPSDPHGRPRNIRPRPFRHDNDPTSGRPSRPTVRTPRSTRSRF
ncbi:unnamed protein product [Microthlaspi erraticum]|uniref:Uncharacterized protein n=1 Tax=Microthlaspi erraticum TaxID=1685480 RepID=A0A6D2JLT1_9BRAS|nr:unnamed protein product [Microthlaspi erraticum]